MITPMTASVAPNVTNSCWRVSSVAATPPARPPMLVATSSERPRRMFTRPRPRLTVADAEAVAITEIRLAAMAVRIGTPRPRVSSGTRKTPPPRPSSEPTRPVAAPVRISTGAEGSSIPQMLLLKPVTSFHKCLWNNELRQP